MSLSQILAVAGIIFELLSFFNQLEFVYRFKRKKERKKAYIDTLGKSIDQEIEAKIQEENRLLLTVGLLVFGLILQAIAIFII